MLWLSGCQTGTRANSALSAKRKVDSVVQSSEIVITGELRQMKNCLQQEFQLNTSTPNQDQKMIDEAHE